MHRWLSCLGVALVVMCGCGSESEIALTADPQEVGEVVARVADQDITAKALMRFQQDTPALLRSEKEGVDAWRDYLTNMIDMELLLLEARQRGLDKGSNFKRQMRQEWRKKLAFEYQVREVKKKSDVPFEQLRERFNKSKWNRFLALAHIRTNTEAEALAVMQEVEDGKPFEEVALERSQNEVTARQGGLIKNYYGRDNLKRYGMPLEVAEDIFDQAVGTLCGPYNIADSYEVFLILQEEKAPVSYLMAFAQTTLVRAFVVERDSVLARLKQQQQPVLEPAGLQAAVALSAQWGGKVLDLPAADANTTLYRLKDGNVSILDLLSFYVKDGIFQPDRLDSSQVLTALEEALLPDALLYHGALAAGLDQDSSLVTWHQMKEKSLLIDALKEEAVVAAMDLSDAAQQHYFETHPEQFQHQEEMGLLEILVDTEQEAADLLVRIKAGEDMQTLAVQFSKRKDAAKKEGIYHLHTKDKIRYGPLYTAAVAAEVDQLHGPLKIVREDLKTTHYSIFKVLEKLPARSQTFEEAARKVYYWLQRQEEARLFTSLFRELKEKHASKVVLFEDRLKMLDVESGI